MRFVLLHLAAIAAVFAQQSAPPPITPVPAPAAGAAAAPGQGQDLDVVMKAVDDMMWQMKLGDIADIDKIEYTSLPPARIPNPKAPGAANPLIIRANTFIPKNLDKSKKHPLIVFAHQGIHANSDTRDAHVFRELIQQGYSIISADYRGSTGYGRGFYQQIDYGGREVDDVHIGMQWMLENYSFLDPKRVGMIGWSHGGLITLMNIFQHPNDLRGRLRRGSRQRSGIAARLPDRRLSRALFGAVSHRKNRARGYQRISQAIAGDACKGIADAAADPHQHQR